MLEDTLGLGEAVSCEQLFFNARPIPAPLLNLVEVASVGVERVVGFFVRPAVVGHLSQQLLGPQQDGAKTGLPISSKLSAISTKFGSSLIKRQPSCSKVILHEFGKV